MMNQRLIRRLATTVFLTLPAAGAAQANVVVVLNSGDLSIPLLDPAHRTELRRFDVGREPHHLMAMAGR